MVHIEVCAEGERCTLRMSGHADYNPGNDIVCAGCSAVVYALAGYVTNAIRERYVEVYDWRLESGDALLDFNGDGGTRAAFEMAVIGLAQIAQQYPGHVSITEKTVV